MPLRAQSLPESVSAPAPRPRPQTRRTTPRVAALADSACRLTARLAANHYEVALNELLSRRRGTRRTTRARHVAMYLAHVVYGLDLAAVAAGFRRDRTTVAYACRAIEDARDDPAFDSALAGLEVSAGVLRESAGQGQGR
jgi:hypothetical protein